MKLKLIPPAIIIYTDRLPNWVGGAALGPFVRIRPKYKDNKPIHAHELLHVAQWWVIGVALAVCLLFVDNPEYYLWIPPLGFTFLYKIPRIRYFIELAAYKKQLKHYPPHKLVERRQLFATFISSENPDRYGFKGRYSYDEVYKDLGN